MNVCKSWDFPLSTISPTGFAFTRRYLPLVPRILLNLFKSNLSTFLSYFLDISDFGVFSFYSQCVVLRCYGLNLVDEDTVYVY